MNNSTIGKLICFLLNPGKNETLDNWKTDMFSIKPWKKWKFDELKTENVLN